MAPKPSLGGVRQAASISASKATLEVLRRSGRGGTAAPGLVRQHLSSTDNSAWPELERRLFDLERDHGHANGVHAPN